MVNWPLPVGGARQGHIRATEGGVQQQQSWDMPGSSECGSASSAQVWVSHQAGLQDVSGN